MNTQALTRRDRVRGEIYWLKYRWHEFWRDLVPRTIAQHLPQRVIYHALIRAWVFSLSGKFGHLSPTEVATFETVQRWDEQEH